MNKKIIILIVILVIGIISIIFFNQNKEDYYLTYANKIIALYDGNYDTDGIKAKDLDAFNNFYNKLKHKDERIDITEYFNFTDEYKINDNSAFKATYYNKKCFINYDDLTLWDNYDNASEGGEIFQKVSCNGYQTILYETMFMPPYDVIVNDPKYNYVIDSYSDSLSGYTFKYKSSYDNTPLTIRLIMEDKKVNEIEVTYD